MPDPNTTERQYADLLAMIGAKDNTEARYILDALRDSRHEALNDAAAYRMLAEHVARQIGCESVTEIPMALADLICRAADIEVDDLAGTQAAGLAEQQEPAEVLQ